MNRDLFWITISCHSMEKEFARARILQTPEADYLYALPDKPNETYSAEEFKKLLEETSFGRTSEMVVWVVNKNSGKRVGLVFPLEWPAPGGTVDNTWALRLAFTEESN